jgi:O-antigen/teichoic acid export membrane protein
MEEDLSRELGKIARSGALALVGLVISALFGFLVRTLIGRYYGPAEYGAYSLAVTVFTITLVVALLGFPTGIQRQLAYHRAREDEDVPLTVSTSILLVLSTSITGTLILEALRSVLPRYLSGGSLLSSLLALLAPSLPFAAVFGVLVAISQGFGRIREYIIYSRIGVPLLYFIFTAIVTILTHNIEYVPLAYLTSYALVLGKMSLDLTDAGILPRRMKFSRRIAMMLVGFSLPLMTSNIVFFIMNWTDTLMLGHYLGEEIVGLYNAAAPTARFIPVFLSSMTVLYTPIATELFARGELRKLSRFYVVVTKWVVLLTFPLFILLVTYPVPVLRVLFGEKYTLAGDAMVILSIGFIFHSIVGPNGLTLITLGKPGENLKGDLIGASLNVLLNYLLIPAYGMSGAALATASSYIATNMYKSLRLLQMGVSLLTERYLRLIAAGVAVVFLSLFLGSESLLGVLLMVSIESAIFYTLALFGGVFEREDIELLRMASRRFNLNLDRIIGILERFSRGEY